MLSTGRPAHPLVEGSLLSILTGGLFLISYYLPVGGVLVSFFCPLPIIIMLVKHELKSGILVILTATFLVTILGGPLLGVVFFWGFAIVGLFMGESIRRGFPPMKLLIINTAIAAVCGLVLLVGSYLMINKNPMTAFQEELAVSFKTSLQIYQKLGLDPAKIKEMAQNIEVITGFIKAAFPALFVLFMGLNVLVIFIVAQHFLLRLNYPVKTLKAFILWRVPEHFVWLFIAGFLLYLSGVTYLIPVGLNLIVIMAAVYFTHGLSLAHFYFSHKHIPRIGKFLFYVLLFLSPPLVIVLILTSVFDLWFNFRRMIFREGDLS